MWAGCSQCAGTYGSLTPCADAHGASCSAYLRQIACRHSWIRSAASALQLIASVNFVVTTGRPVRSFFHVVSVT